jgi:putative transposase
LVTPAARRDAVAHLEASFEVSERRACAIICVGSEHGPLPGDAPRRRHVARAVAEARDQRRRFGYRRLHVLLRGEGWTVNRKKTQRLYGEEDLVDRI